MFQMSKVSKSITSGASWFPNLIINAVKKNIRNKKKIACFISGLNHFHFSALSLSSVSARLKSVG